MSKEKTFEEEMKKGKCKMYGHPMHDKILGSCYPQQTRNTMNKKNKNYLYSILGTPKQLLGKHLGKHICCDGECLHDDCCGKISENCPKPKSPLKVGKGWKKIFKIK